MHGDPSSATVALSGNRNHPNTGEKPVVARSVPHRQPLPTVVIDPAKPLLKLELDVHLEFFMAAVQNDHASPTAASCRAGPC